MRNSKSMAVHTVHPASISQLGSELEQIQKFASGECSGKKINHTNL